MEDLTINTRGEDSSIVKNQLRFMRIVFFGLPFGMVLLLGAVFLSRAKGTYPEADIKFIRIMTVMSMIVTACGVLVSVVVRVNAERIMGRAESFSKALGRYLCAMVVALGTCEGGATMCVITIAVGGRTTILLMMFCVAMIAMWLHFPGKGRLAEAYEMCRHRHVEEEQLGR